MDIIWLMTNEDTRAQLEKQIRRGMLLAAEKHQNQELAKLIKCPRTRFSSFMNSNGSLSKQQIEKAVGLLKDLGHWSELEPENPVVPSSDPIEDSIGVLRKALELAEKRGNPRGERAAQLLELLVFIERHFAAKLRKIRDGD